MPLIFGCIAPHAERLIEEETLPAEMYETYQALSKMTAQLEKLKPDTIIIATPHGIQIEGSICLSVSENAFGRLKSKVSVKFKVDFLTARKIGERAKELGLPIAQCTFGSRSGSSSRLPLDWGSIVPLHFLGAHYNPTPQLIVICPSRGVLRQNLFDFGKVISEVAHHSPKRIALIASADQAHRHLKTGPYGFHSDAIEYDKLIVETIRQDRLETLLDLDENLIKTARPDSFWQMLILAGALSVQPLRCGLLTYDVSSYFGLACALYE